MENTENNSAQGTVIATGDVIKETTFSQLVVNEEKDIFVIERVNDFKVDGKSLTPAPVRERVQGKISEVPELKAFLDFARNYTKPNEEVTN